MISGIVQLSGGPCAASSRSATRPWCLPPCQTCYVLPGPPAGPSPNSLHGRAARVPEGTGPPARMPWAPAAASQLEPETDVWTGDNGELGEDVKRSMKPFISPKHNHQPQHWKPVAVKWLFSYLLSPSFCSDKRTMEPQFWAVTARRGRQIPDFTSF